MANINPQPGDKLSRPKGLFTHTGIYIGFGRVFHSTDDQGPHVSSLADFADGNPVTVHPANDADRPAILSRVRDELHHNRNYDLLFNNCQHAASRAAVGRASSEDLQAMVIISTLSLILFIGSKIK
jgi:Lecithin retinol acyltransferase